MYEDDDDDMPFGAEGVTRRRRKRTMRRFQVSSGRKRAGLSLVPTSMRRVLYVSSSTRSTSSFK